MNQIVDSPSVPETFSKRPSWLPSHHLDVVCLSLIGLTAVALTAPGFFAPTTGSSPWIIDNILHGLRQRTLESTIFWYPMLQSNVLAMVIMGYLGFGWITGLWSSAEVYAKIIDPFQFLFLAEGLSLLFGMGAILATYYLGRLVLDRRAGWIAAAILALTPTFNMHLYNGKPDAAMTCLSAVAFIFLMKSLREASYRNYIGGGLFMGLAVAAKYNAAILIFAGLLVHLAAWRKDRAPLGHLIHPRFFAAIMAGGLTFALTSFEVFLQPRSFLYPLLVSEPDKKIIAVFGVDPASFIPWVGHAAVFFKTEHGSRASVPHGIPVRTFSPDTRNDRGLSRDRRFGSINSSIHNRGPIVIVD